MKANNVPVRITFPGEEWCAGYYRPNAKRQIAYAFVRNRVTQYASATDLAKAKATVQVDELYL